MDSLGKKPSSREGTELAELPDDVVAKIFLSRSIGVKTLCKLRCVCKQWRCVLSDPYFQDLHHKRSKKTPMLVYLDSNPLGDKEILYSIDLDYDKENQITGKNKIMPSTICSHFTLLEGRNKGVDRIHQLGSANGLICFATGRSFYLCNPSVKEVIKLPEPNLAHIQPNGKYSRMVWGFAFNASRNEYVVVHLITSQQYFITGCEILTFPGGTGTVAGGNNNGNSSGLLSWGWRKMGDEHPYNIDDLGDGVGTSVDGVFYWRVGEDTIISFDLDEEKYEHIPLPPAPGLLDPDLIEGGGFPSLVELRGNLCFVDPSAGDAHPTPSMEVWMLVKEKKNTERTTSSWIKEYSIPLPGFSYEYDFIALGDRDGDGGLIIYKTGTTASDHGGGDDEEFNREQSLWHYDAQDNCLRKLKSLRNLDIYEPTLNLCLHTDNFFSFSLGSKGGTSSK